MVAGLSKLRLACTVLPQVLLFMAWVSWYNYFSGDPFAAFMETMVACPTPVPTANGTCPTGSTLSKETCQAVPSHDPEWSLSEKCADQALVLKTTSEIQGMNGAVAAVLAMGSVFLSGTTMDAFGRKPVLIAALLVNVVVKLLLFLSCFLSWTGFEVVLMVQNVLMVMAMTPMYPAMNAMVGDLTQGDESKRGTCFAAMEVVNHAMDVLAFVCGFPVLAMHLGDYSYFWGSLTVVGAGALVFFTFTLKETRSLPTKAECKVQDITDLEAAPESRAGVSGVRQAVADCFGGFVAVGRDPVLRQFFIIWALASLAMNSTWGLAGMYAQSHLHLSQEMASISRALWQLALTVGSMLSSPLIERKGAKATLVIAMLTIALAWGVVGLAAVLPVSASILFWVSGVGVGGVAFGMMTPSSNTLISGRVDESLMGKVFSCQIIVNTIIGTPLGLLWPYVVFDPQSTGLRAGVMWLVSAAIFVVCAVWVALLTAQRPQKTASEQVGETAVDKQVDEAAVARTAHVSQNVHDEPCSEDGI